MTFLAYSESAIQLLSIIDLLANICFSLIPSACCFAEFIRKREKVLSIRNLQPNSSRVKGVKIFKERL